MTTQIINGQLFAMSGPLAAPAAKGASGPGKSFGDFMGGTLAKLSSPAKPSVNSDAGGGSDAPGQETGPVEGANPANPDAAVDQQPPKADSADDSESAKEAGETQKTEEGEKTGAADGKKAEDAKEKLQDLVKEVLGISQEQLEQLMAGLGFTMTDLADLNNLKLLVVKANGGEHITDLLTSEGMENQVNALTKGMEELKLSDGTPLSREELASLLQAAQENAAAGQSSRSGSKEAQNIRLETEEPAKEAAPAEQEPAVTVTVEKADAGKAADENTANTHAKAKSDRHSLAGGEKTPEITPAEAFIQKLSDARMNGRPVNRMEPVQVMREIVNQVAERIHIVMKPETTSMEMQLNPEQLGKVHVSVTENKNGQMTAAFTVQNEAAREAIEGQIQMLRESLDKQGLKVDAVEVTVSEFGFAQSEGQSQTGGEKKKTPRRLHLDELNESGREQLSGEENLAADIMEQNGNTVDYTA